MTVIPELPGVIIPRNSGPELWLREHIAKLCHLSHDGFPGSQPVSFGANDLASLEKQDYWVCEKSDGVRVLFSVLIDSQGSQIVCIIDRHNIYRELSGFFFPHHGNPLDPLRNTIVDAELVVDVDPRTKQRKLCLLVFDGLVVDDQNVMSKTLDKRYGRLTEWFFKPYAKMLRDHPHVVDTHPFEIKMKEISFSYHVEKVFEVDIPALQHSNDGLIYTCVNTPYTPGTDHNILKWKPPSENTVDFKLVVRFPPLPSDPTQPDFYAKPMFLLHVWCGDVRGAPKYEPYDDMYVDDDEWEQMKSTGEQIDDRIAEVRWDPEISRWRMVRFRNDKPNGNHKSVVEMVVQSIADGVEKETLLERSIAIRNAWKARHGQPQSQHPPPPPPAPPVPRARAASIPAPERTRQMLPHADLRYGPLALSRWSKVSGPEMIAGMKR